MDGSNAPNTAQPSPIEAERDRLRKAGYTDAEISQILINKEVGATPKPAAGHHGTMSGVASNLVAAAGYAQNFVPSVIGDVKTLGNATEKAEARTQAAIYLILKVVIVLVIGYVVMLEFSQLRSTTAKSFAEACLAQRKVVNDNTPFFSYNDPNYTKAPLYKRYKALLDDYNRDCAEASGYQPFSESPATTTVTPNPANPPISQELRDKLIAMTPPSRPTPEPTSWQYVWHLLTSPLAKVFGAVCMVLGIYLNWAGRKKEAKTTDAASGNDTQAKGE